MTAFSGTIIQGSIRMVASVIIFQKKKKLSSKGGEEFVVTPIYFYNIFNLFSKYIELQMLTWSLDSKCIKFTAIPRNF